MTVNTYDFITHTTESLRLSWRKTNMFSQVSRAKMKTRLARLLLATLDTAGQPASSVSVVAMVTIDAPFE